MEASSFLLMNSSSSSSAASAATFLSFNSPNFIYTSSSPKKTLSFRFTYGYGYGYGQIQLTTRLRSWASTSPLQVTVDNGTSTSTSPKDMMLPKVDKSGRFCSPRAARELALSILYAACLDGSDPVRLFEKRVNTRREAGYEFDPSSLMEYDHMSFGGPPVTTESAEEADEILQIDQKESDIEAEVLSAPPKLVYSKLILRFTRKLLVAVAENWDSNVLAIEKITPSNWKNQPAGRILEFSVLHLAMSEIAVLGTRHQIVINEAVDLAKRFCDGAAPRIVNGCLRTFVKDFNRNDEAESVKIRRTV